MPAILVADGAPPARLQPPAIVASLKPCAADQLSLALDGENGQFDGMSHSGALLVIRNIGDAPCRVPAEPPVRFLDGREKPLPIEREVAAGSRPGPALPPVGIAAGAEVTAPLRWVSGDVYAGGRCLRPARVSVAIGTDALTTAFATTICGPAGKPAGFEQSRLAPDPQLAP